MLKTHSSETLFCEAITSAQKKGYLLPFFASLYFHTCLGVACCSLRGREQRRGNVSGLAFARVGDGKRRGTIDGNKVRF